MRVHPALLKEKIDNEKQFKHLIDTDASLEWRQYCLDPLCTNYNQVIQNVFKHGSHLNLNQSFLGNTATTLNNIPNNSMYSLLMPPSLPKFINPSQTPVTLSQYGYADQTPTSSQLMPLSPSYIFSNTNRTISI